MYKNKNVQRYPFKGTAPETSYHTPKGPVCTDINPLGVKIPLYLFEDTAPITNCCTPKSTI